MTRPPVILIGGPHHGKILSRRPISNICVNIPDTDLGRAAFTGLSTAAVLVHKLRHFSTYRPHQFAHQHDLETFYAHDSLTQEDATEQLWDLLWERVVDGAEPLPPF